MIVSNRIARALALTFVAGSLARAQTAPAPSSAAPAAPSAAIGAETVVLPEFEISEKSPNGYVASETMSGSRVNTKIIDLPYSIVNLTQEFFHDNNITILDDNMTYIGGLTGISIGGGFNLRGFASTSMLRDGFYRLGRYGLSNIQEVEIIRGPEAGIYGRASPGGMVNFISVPPSPTQEQTLTVKEGSYSQSLAKLQMTGTIDKAGKADYVVILDETNRDYPSAGIEQIHNQEYFAALKYAFNQDTHLLVSAEYFLQKQHGVQAAPPLVLQAITAVPGNTATTQAIGYDMPLAEYNPSGPNTFVNRGSNTFELVFDHTFNEHWSTRLGAYRFMARAWSYGNGISWGTITLPLAGATSQGVPTPITSSRGSLPSYGIIFEDGGGFQEDLVGNYKLLNGLIESKTLATVDFNDYYRFDPTWEFGANTDPNLVAWNAATLSATNPVAGIASGRAVVLQSGYFHDKLGLLPTLPLAYFGLPYNSAEGVIFTPPGNGNTGGPALNGGTLTRRRTSSLGGNLSEKLTALDGKLIVFGGLRIDNVLFSQRDYTVAFTSVGFGSAVGPNGFGLANGMGGSVVRRYEHQRKPNTGFNYQVLPNLHVYGSYSTAYFVDQTSRPAVIASSTYAPFTAQGFDYGVKGSYFDQRLNFTVGGFYDREFNVLVTDVTETFPGSGTYTDVPAQDGDQLVRGWEADGSWVVTKDDSLIVGESFGHVSATYTNFGSAFPEVPGRSVSGITPNNGSAYAKYIVVSGPLKGLSFNPLVTYVASTPTQSPNSGDTSTIVNGVATITAHTDQWKIRLPSFTLWNFSMGYRIPSFSSKWDQRISLSVNNLLNKYYLRTSALQGDGRAIVVSYEIHHF